MRYLPEARDQGSSLPRRASPLTNPKVRESLEWLRLSPITKYWFAGTATAWPSAGQELLLTHGSGK
jgi:hypothetical protein